MGATLKIALGVAGGYLLGRTKKLKLAITLGGMLAGKRLAGGGGGLLPQGADLLDKSPELAKLQKDSGALVEAVKAAALTTATQRLHTLGDTLRGGPEDSGEGASDESDEGSEESADTGENEQADSEQRPAAKKAASKKPGQKSAKKSTQKTAKKAAKKTTKQTTGTDRSSSGG